MTIQLSEHFTYPKLLRFILPSVIMMIFTSIYSVVDGLFISNFAGKTPFAAINLIMPLFSVLGALGFMIGTGGTAIVSMKLGEGKREIANQYFSMLIYTSIAGGILLTIAGQLLLRPISILLGATGDILEYSVLYGRIVLSALTCFMLQNVFQSFLIAAEKPKLGLFITIAAGVANIILDALFVAVWKWGIAGAAAATSISQAIGAILPILYFSRKNSSLLRLTRARFDGKVFLKTCTNGSSELMTNISASIVTMLYNFQLMSIAGEDGIAAYGVIMYANFIFSAIFFGYAIGSAPLTGYHYGAGNHSELKNLFQKSVTLIGITGAVLTLMALLTSRPLSQVFVGYDAELFELTNHGFRLYAISFLLCGFNIFGSAFFTALNNGVISAAISFLRTFVFQIAAVLILPQILAIDGIWLAIVAAELLSFGITCLFFYTQKNRYHYV